MEEKIEYEVEALYNAVIVKPINREDEEVGGIIVPDMGKESALKGAVVSVGPFYYSATGTKIETQLKVGDLVLLPQMGPVKFEFEGEEYYTCAENTILSRLRIKNKK